MSLLQGIGADFSKFEILRAKKKTTPTETGASTSEQALQPPPAPSHDEHTDDVSQGLSFSPEQATDAGFDSLPAISPNPLIPIEEEMDRTLAEFFNGPIPSSHAIEGGSSSLYSCPDTHDSLIVATIGEKRLRNEEVCDSSVKQPKTLSAPPASVGTLPIGFPQPSPGHINAFRSLGKTPTFGIPSSCDVSSMSLGNAPAFGTSSSSGASPSMSRPGFFTKDYPLTGCHSITPVEWDELSRIAARRHGFDDSPLNFSFLSQRAGSTVIPSPEAEFNHALGNQFYVPASTLRLRDDGRGPTTARGFIDSVVPPLRAAEASFFSYSCLAQIYDTAALNSLVSGTLMRQSLLQEIERLNGVIGDYKGKIGHGHKMMSHALEELKKEKEICASLRAGSDKIDREWQNLLSEVMQLQTRNNQLQSQLSKQASQVQRLSSSQQDIEQLKTKLAHERESKAGLLERIQKLEGDVQEGISLRRDPASIP